eukprot:7388036-Prymnesium_polylepis.1
MKNGSILSYDGSLPIAGVHALTWVLAAIFGLVVYLEVCNCPIASEDTKRMCLLSFILPIIIALVALLLA